MIENIKDNEIWTKVPYEIKYEFGFTWISVIFSLLISIHTFKQYLETNDLLTLIIFVLASLLFILFMYKRFVKNTAIVLSEEGIQVFPLLSKPYFVKWNEINKIYIYTNMLTYHIVKAIYFSYKDETKNIFTYSKRLPIYAYFGSNLKRLQLLHEKYK